MGYYDDIAEGYEELHKDEQIKKIALIKEHFDTKPSDKLLDVGCGTGLTTELWNCERYGIDPAIRQQFLSETLIWLFLSFYQYF